MIYFTAYANQKFTLLNEHNVFIRKEQVEQTLLKPEKRGKLGSCLTAQSDDVKVVYKKENGIIKVITFYPV